MKIDKSKLYPLYDQYSNPENRLTHALLHTISSSDHIFSNFLKHIVGIKKYYKSGVFEVSTQKVPFSHGADENEEEKSVPDAWIVNDKTQLGVVIEVKDKKKNVNLNQIKKHSQKVSKYKNPYLLVITPDINEPEKITKLTNSGELGVNLIWLSWDKIYRFFKRLLIKDGNIDSKDKFLLTSLIEYLEGRMDVLGFQGIFFDKKEGFEIRRAKDILKTEMDELQPFVKTIYGDLVIGRPAITMLTKSSVWNCFGDSKGFTNDIHFTLGINEESHNVALVVPNSSKNAWKRLKKVFSDDKYRNDLISILGQLRKNVPCIYVEFVQRHFIARKKGIEDGKLHFNLDVIGEPFSRKNSKTKISEIWFPALKDAIVNKKNLNGQVAFITKFFYRNTKDIDQPSFLNTVKNTLKNYKPIYEYLRGD